MADTQRARAIVAELGRPETATETAVRKAETSRLYRQRKTVNNLVFSLLVSLALVLLIVLVVPRGTDTWKAHSVDVASAAAETAPTAGQPLVAPTVPDGWLAKQAELRSGPNRIAYWYIGYTTSAEAYAAVDQVFTADGTPVDETWVAQRLEAQTATGTESIGGVQWTVYDHSSRSADNANMKFGLQASIGATTFLVYGTDSPEAIRGLAASVAEQAMTNTSGRQPATEGAQ